MKNRHRTAKSGDDLPGVDDSYKLPCCFDEFLSGDHDVIVTYDHGDAQLIIGSRVARQCPV